MSKDQALSDAAAASGPKPVVMRDKRSISEIRESKRAKKKWSICRFPDYTSAKWAELAGVDVAVIGDSLAIRCGGIIPPTITRG
jgi:3-methyl-2-oxobutanoate hydroxymethyltransferase